MTSIAKRAEEDPGATSMCPPRWAESLLRRVLKPRDQESILGDLLEEYREERLSKLGRTCANLWYIRQMLGIAFFQALKGGLMKRSLLCLCFFTLAASIWFGIMETAQRYSGVVPHDVRLIWAVMLAVVSLITILYLVFPGYRLLRILLSLGAVSMLNPGVVTTAMVIRSTHVEVYMLLFGAAAILQLVLAILALAFVSDVPDSRIHLQSNRSGEALMREHSGNAGKV
jgi:hypothetical protein